MKQPTSNPALCALLVKIQAAAFNFVFFSRQEMQVFDSSCYASLHCKYFIEQYYEIESSIHEVGGRELQSFLMRYSKYDYLFSA